MPLPAPEPLGQNQHVVEFDCGKPALNDWLIRHARQGQASGSAKTFVVTEGVRVAGYSSLTVGQVDTLEAPERIRQGMGQYPIPVVNLAGLAVSGTEQGLGIGYGLLQDAIRRTLLIADQVGILALLTHPIDEQAARFTPALASWPPLYASSSYCHCSRMPGAECGNPVFRHLDQDCAPRN